MTCGDCEKGRCWKHISTHSCLPLAPRFSIPENLAMTIELGDLFNGIFLFIGAFNRHGAEYTERFCIGAHTVFVVALCLCIHL